MTPREVRGLQALAKAHGGSLTINPHTGLAEAGFLRNLLPMIAGAALASTGIGAPAAAALIGGGTALAKGDLKAGLMAGLGAYGGAGLAQGAFTAGATPGGDAVLAEGAGAGVPPAPDITTATATPVETIQAGQPAASATQPYVDPSVPTSSAQTGFTQTPANQSVANLTPEQYGSQARTAEAGFGDAQFEPRPGITSNNYANTYQGQNPATSLKPESMATRPAPSGTGFDRVGQNFMAQPSYGIAAIAPGLVPDRQALPEEEKYEGPLSNYKFDPNKYRSSDRSQPNPYYQPRMYNYAGGGPVEQMSNANAIGQNTGYPMANLQQGAYAAPWQTPMSENVVQGSADVGVNRMTGEQTFAGGGGISSLGGYSDGGRMLKGPGDGMSDSIPAQIGSKQPARLADGEFVVPADVVSHLGNGSTDAGARQLYSMMDRIRAQRTGKKKQAPKVNPTKAMPA
jgi:hypothetical protein